MSFPVPTAIRSALGAPGAEILWLALIQFAASSDPDWLFVSNPGPVTIGSNEYQPGLLDVKPWQTTLCNAGQPPAASCRIEDANDKLRASIENVPPENAAITCSVTTKSGSAWQAPFSIVSGVIADATTKQDRTLRATEISIVPRLFATAATPLLVTQSAVSGDALAKQALQTKTKWTD